MLRRALRLMPSIAERCAGRDNDNDEASSADTGAAPARA